MVKALLVAEGSGGHLIPALQVAKALAKAGVQARVWYAKREPIAPLANALAEDSRSLAIEVDPISVKNGSGFWGRLSECRQLWSRAEACFDEFDPDVVVGFGGWISAPVLLAARKRGIGCLVHEQNVVLGRANHLLSRVAQRVAVSFPETCKQLSARRAVMTGMPVRTGLGDVCRAEAAERFHLSADRTTLLVLGGSQGSRVLNRLMIDLAAGLSPEEAETWQIIHITGAADLPAVRGAYQAANVASWSEAFLADMDPAYALADVVLARAGASTIAELARCGKPALLIPFPHAGGHQRANASVVESAGAGIVMDEKNATAAETHSHLRRIFSDTALRQFMAKRMLTLNHADAAEKITREILELAALRLSA